ncbi:glycyl-radical enzyme activating protein [Gordonibacter sp. An230]|uniref:glycyl-radical enzyme activating protein n=1 Tax=Gordonibacter sp. An230 TaxID=1965592 RepID=UPI001950277A|nr:glycyl-radical enzyme activating protein [Gordonibacter sp. An230]
MEKGCVFNIQKYSVHDGPGIRTIVYLKGCPLRCKWCCNPESQLEKPQIAYNIEKCIGDVCLLCEGVCPRHNIAFMDTNKVWIDHGNCINCLQCAKVCPAGAIISYGEYREASDVVDEVERDLTFYSRSGGGMTLSGGEPLLQADYALALLKEAKRRGINTAIETCGCVPWKRAEEVFSYLDYAFFDIKSMDAQKHKEWTGWDNSVVLDTFRNMREAYPELKTRVRTPVVPGFNDTEDDIRAIRDLARSYPNTDYELLRYHRYGTTKYTFIGKEYELGDQELDDALFERLKQISNEE